MPDFRPDIITVLGPTATGKTRIAALLCHTIGGEVISADSRQVYREMNIGTGKDYDDYVVNQTRIPCHCIDIRPAGYNYNVFEFQRDFLAAYKTILNNEHFPVLCGGTGLYIDSVLKGYRLTEVPVNAELRKYLSEFSAETLTEKLKSYKTLHNTTDTGNRQRLIRAIEIEDYYEKNPETGHSFPKLNSFIAGITCDRETRRKRISDRLKKRIGSGLIEEVESLLKTLSTQELIYYGLEYKITTEYLTGKYSFEDYFTKLETAIHQFAKRQMTYFRGMERKGAVIHWFDCNTGSEKIISRIIEMSIAGKTP